MAKFVLYQVFLTLIDKFLLQFKKIKKLENRSRVTYLVKPKINLKASVWMRNLKCQFNWTLIVLLTHMLLKCLVTDTLFLSFPSSASFSSTLALCLEFYSPTLRNSFYLTYYSKPLRSCLWSTATLLHLDSNPLCLALLKLRRSPQTWWL